ncbi:SDR family NAD(P)-dependent oxidoreductase [Pseudophaeobacter flagellatus]|uniref:SDR family NAD(P)-dependent oxidoreductase n=1 Tax=Pseudophaeobacter flagellatus TaxID=2899119 RepID=UPI001E2CEF9A|nr:SDR family NAD(P)-dependent oxidoreductase [Pseudophaeobacter flagellatus]MCD9149217.1 SDR family NAD(P)-dependent oxidoreductase [Pseudophaeobacter flagellatus]
MSLAGKTYWLVGASEGLGRELAVQMDKAGARLVLSARSADKLAALIQDLTQARALPLDVTDAEAVRHICSELGPVDGVIYNAGAYEPMATQDWQAESALQMADVNFIGALRVLGEIMPRFVAQGHGDVTLIGSLAGYRGLPNAIGYGASKAALISLAETMRHDLKGSGITVRLINPGFIKTRLTDKNTFKMPMLMTAAAAAQRVLCAMQSRRFRTDFPRPFSWGIKLYSLLPDLLAYRGR